MHKTASDAAGFVRRLHELVSDLNEIDAVLAPPFTALAAAAQHRPPGSPFLLGAQNLYWEDEGAFTGEVSAPMLADLGCEYVIVGHSERRQVFGEQDEGINKKVRAALRHRLRPILCVGESLADRDEGRTGSVVTEQFRRGLQGVPAPEVARITLAYEPVWAIGTGRAATVAQAEEVHQLLRTALATHWGPEAGDRVRILYGGSVSPANAGDLFASPHIDGGLVGGACLDPHSFARILAAGQQAMKTANRSFP